MKKLNGVVFDGKFYEAEKGENCDKQITQKLNGEKPLKIRRK